MRGGSREREHRGARLKRQQKGAVGLCSDVLMEGPGEEGGAAE